MERKKEEREKQRYKRYESIKTYLHPLFSSCITLEDIDLVYKQKVSLSSIILTRFLFSPSEKETIMLPLSRGYFCDTNNDVFHSALGEALTNHKKGVLHMQYTAPLSFIFNFPPCRNGKKENSKSCYRPKKGTGNRLQGNGKRRAV